MKGSPDGKAPPFHLAYGSYLGIAAAGLVLVGLALAGEASLPSRPTLRRLCAAVLSVGTLVALLLPWQQDAVNGHESGVTTLGIAAAPGLIAAVAALCVLLGPLAGGRVGALTLAGLALVTLLFAAAASTTYFSVRDYGAWIGLGCAAAAALVQLADRSLLRALHRPSWRATGAAVAGAALVASLFLPWQTACYGNTSDLEAAGIAGTCTSANGFGIAGSTAALIALALVLAAAAVPALLQAFSRLELAAYLALLIATLALEVQTGTRDGVRLGFGHGAIVGLVAAVALIAVALAPPWRRPFARPAPPVLLPIALAILFTAAVVVPWWDVLPQELWSTFVQSMTGLTWLTLAVALAGVRLVFLWARAGESAYRGPELVLLSLGLIVLVVLAAVPLPTVRLNWNLAVLLGLAVPLLLLALYGERQSIRNLKVPETLRVDRL
jgi:hypothetical protein